MKLLITIVARGKGELVTKLLEDFKSDYSITFLGEGTASNQMIEYLSLTNKLKDVVLSIIHQDDEKQILEAIEKKFNLTKKKIGIALTLPLSSMNRLALDQILSRGGYNG